jgi:choline dehydrogenase-like flavoprotein
MGENEENGVIDKNLKAFGKDNLYICDGSIFTTAGNVNNGLTISAFACRLAEYLEKKI